MENKFHKNNVEKPQLLRAYFIFLWLFAAMGISLPPTLIDCTTGYQKRRIKCIWLCFTMHSIMFLVMVLWIVYINNVIVDVVVENFELDSITSVLSLSTNVTVAFVQMIMQAATFIKHKNIKSVVGKIAELERDIFRYYLKYQWLQHDDINFNLNYQRRCQRFSHYIVWRYSLFFIVFGSLLTYINYHLISDLMSLRDIILTLLCTLILQMKALEFCIVIEIITQFITSLHNYLECLKYEIGKTNGQPLMGLICHKKLMANQFLTNRTWLLVTDIEEYFAIPLLVLYLFNGIVITHTINWSYVRSFPYPGKDSLGMFRLCYIIVLLLNMFLPCWLTQSCIEKYKQFGSILHNIKTHNDKILDFRIREYSLQLKHQEMLFTCAGYFDINLRYYGLMILAISTYVAILIQFKLQKETEKANIRL